MFNEDYDGMCVNLDRSKRCYFYEINSINDMDKITSVLSNANSPRIFFNTIEEISRGENKFDVLDIKGSQITGKCGEVIILSLDGQVIEIIEEDHFYKKYHVLASKWSYHEANSNSAKDDVHQSKFEEILNEEKEAESNIVGYHKAEIKRGKYGTLSKIQEELDEAKDAEEQDIDIMLLVELSDLYGAIEGYLNEKFPNVTMDDLKAFSDVTKRAFRSGRREENNADT